jgi:putative transcriptional regulator
MPTSTKKPRRDLEAELRQSLKDIKTGKIGRVSIVTDDGKVIVSPVAKARLTTRLSQSQFAALMGVSPRTLQDWEQGRREPTGAARTLLRVAATHPEVLRKLVA